MVPLIVPLCRHPQVIRVGEPAMRKPPGILWERLSPQKLSQIRVLQQLKQRIEAEQGAPLPCGPDEVLPPTAARGPRRGRSTNSKNSRRPIRDGKRP